MNVFKKIPIDFFREENFPNWKKDDSEHYIYQLYHEINFGDIDTFDVVMVSIREFGESDEFDYYLGFEKVKDDDIAALARKSILKEQQKPIESKVLVLGLWGPNIGECTKNIAGIICCRTAPNYLQNHPFYKYRYKWHFFAILDLFLAYIVAALVISHHSFLRVSLFLLVSLPIFFLFFNRRKWFDSLLKEIEDLFQRTGFDFKTGSSKKYYKLSAGVIYSFSTYITILIWFMFAIGFVIFIMI